SFLEFVITSFSSTHFAPRFISYGYRLCNVMTISEGAREGAREGLPLPIFRQVANLTASSYDYFVGRSVGRSVDTLHEPGIIRFVRTGTFRTGYLVVYSTARPSLPLPRST